MSSKDLEEQDANEVESVYLVGSAQQAANWDGPKKTEMEGQ